MKIEIPTNCPVCDSVLVKVNDQLFCRNKACEAQSLKKIEHFAKAMKIKGLGPSSIEKLAFDSIEDLFTFSEGYYTDALGATVGKKLFAEVHKAKSNPLSLLLAGFGIPLFGEVAARKLANHVRHIDNINLETCKVAALGTKQTEKLLEFLETEEYSRIRALPLNFSEEASKSELGVSVCITGKLTNFSNRTQAATYLTTLGFTVTDSVTKQTKVLIDEEGRTSSKRTKANQLNIPILTIDDLLKEYKVNDNQNLD